ncbi:MAG: serine/threonine-protein kinase [Rivularia sp. (in: cyanobacteria)]
MIGKFICDRYQVIKILNQGMFCQTYIVRDITITDYPTCIVKHFLPSDRIALPVKTRRRLFIREVEALVKLDNYEYVPLLLNHFERDREFYLVQEFIKGHSLSTELQPGKCWSQTQVIELLQEVLCILICVHAQGLIHRDVKPSNIMRRERDNRLVLIDFGAVKPIFHELLHNQRHADSTTIAIGTPGYMPYEQHQGRPVPSSDIYALGAIGIQALTGVHPIQLPKDSNTGEITWRHLVKVNTKLAVIINKMVCYHSQNRYKSAKEALAALIQLTDLYPRIQSNAALQGAKIWSNSSIALSEKETHPVAGFDSSQSDPIPSTTLPQNNVDRASVTDTIISNFPHKSALYIGLVIGVVSGLALIIFSYLSIQTIYSTPKLQNLQMQKPQSR